MMLIRRHCALWLIGVGVGGLVILYSDWRSGRGIFMAEQPEDNAYLITFNPFRKIRFLQPSRQIASHLSIYIRSLA